MVINWMVLCCCREEYWSGHRLCSPSGGPCCHLPPPLANASSFWSSCMKSCTNFFDLKWSDRNCTFLFFTTRGCLYLPPNVTLKLVHFNLFPALNFTVLVQTIFKARQECEARVIYNHMNFQTIDHWTVTLVNTFLSQLEAKEPKRKQSCILFLSRESCGGSHCCACLEAHG